MTRMRARTNACGASVTVAAPNRNGRRKRTGRSYSSMATMLKFGCTGEGRLESTRPV
jgi:hypothetical protein